MQYSWRVDGLVPIIYSEDFTKIPIPIFKSEIKEKIVNSYYCEINRNVSYNANNYLYEEKKRNMSLGIYQLNREVLLLKRVINRLMDNIVKGKSIIHNYNILFD